jgi:hypothetical protein
MGTLIVATVCVAILSGCGGSAAGPATTEIAAEGKPETDSPPGEQICGLALPCSSPEIDNPHDLYGAMVVAFSEHGALLVSEGSSPGCVTCADPRAFFDALLDDPRGNQGALAHVYLSLAEVARARATAGTPPSPATVWSDLHDQITADLESATGSSEPTTCGLLTAYCASTPLFVDGFATFLERLLFREPLDEDPGFQKEHAVKLALAANPPGGLEVIIRFIESGAAVRARMKAVRDICAYVPHYQEARAALEWVIDNDAKLADRARACLFKLRDR